MMIQINVKREVFRFTSHARWVSKAAGWFSQCDYATRQRMISVDSLDRICHDGDGFRRARDDDAFPVVVYETF